MRRNLFPAGLLGVFLINAGPLAAADQVPAIEESKRLLMERRVDDALAKLSTAEAEVHNLRGACFVERRDFALAKESYEKAAALQPANPSIRFNLAEIDFVQKNWVGAEKRFVELKPMLPVGNARMAELVDLKLMICRQKQGVAVDAPAEGDSTSPFGHYSEAVAAFSKGDAKTADALLAEVRNLFDAKTLAPWNDTMIEAGYLAKK